MNIKTITTSEGVTAVDFGSSANRYYWFINKGTTTVHVSGNADISADADGVAELAAGGSVCIETLGGKVYILGEGTVEIHNTGDKFCPFKLAPVGNGGGGSAVDAYTKAESDARYPLKTAIPTSLPANGGNSATVNGHTVNADVPANAKFTDTVQNLTPYAKKTEIPTSLPANGGTAALVTSLRHEISYNDIFSTTLASTHGCWNKWCFVMGSSNNTASSDYIANAPEAISAIWYEVFTGGRINRAFQIAIGCYKHQRNMFIRYQHDGTWSGWNKISPAETLQEYGVTPTLTNGTATAIAVSFNPQVVLLMNNGHVITGGYAIAMGAKKFTVTPSAVSTMGTVAPNYIAFG